MEPPYSADAFTTATLTQKQARSAGATCCAKFARRSEILSSLNQHDRGLSSVTVCPSQHITCRRRLQETPAPSKSGQGTVTCAAVRWMVHQVVQEPLVALCWTSRVNGGQGNS